MGKKRRSSVLDAINSFNATYGMTKGYLQDSDMREISDAQEIDNSKFTEDQGKQLEDAAAGGANITYDQSKRAYVVTPAGGDAQTVEMAKRGVTFLGKDYDTPISDGQKDSARMMAMTGVYSKYGDPMKAMQMKNQARSGELADIQIKGALRGEKRAEREDAYEAGLPDLMKGSRFAMKQAAGEKYGIADSLADNATLLAYGAQHGKVDPEKWMGLASKMEQVEREGYSRALTLADSGADVAKIADEFNKSGNVKFDPAAVVSDKMGMIKLRGQDVPTRIIQFKDDKGNIQTINTASELAGLGEAKNLLETHFAGQRDKRDGQRLGIQDAQLSMERDKFNAGAAGRGNAESAAKLQAVLSGTTDPAERAKITQQINDLTGTAGVDANAPAEVKLARAAVQAGLQPDMKSALEWAVTKKSTAPDELHKEFVASALKTNPNGARAVQAANSVMTEMGYKQNGGKWVAAQGAGGAKPLKDVTPADISATAKKYGISEDEVKKKLGIK